MTLETTGSLSKQCKTTYIARLDMFTFVKELKKLFGKEFLGSEQLIFQSTNILILFL